MPAVFAFADKVIGQPQTSLFAAFGSFALLVLVEFTGPPRTRLVAYLALACVGAAFITFGTLCSRHAWLAAGAMAVVGFATLFAGVINGYFAAAATGALLMFVLPVTIPAPNSAILDRLEGWGLAAGAGDLRPDAPLAASPARRPCNARPPAHCVPSPTPWTPTASSWAERARLARESGRRSGPAPPRGPAPPDRPDRPDSRPRLASRRARLAPLLSYAVSGTGARAGLRRGRRSDGGGRRRSSCERRATRGPRRTARFRSGSKRRAMPSRAHSCGGCRSCRPIPRRARCRGRSTLRSESAR